MSLFDVWRLRCCYPTGRNVNKGAPIFLRTVIKNLQNEKFLTVAERASPWWSIYNIKSVTSYNMQQQTDNCVFVNRRQSRPKQRLAHCGKYPVMTTRGILFCWLITWTLTLNAYKHVQRLTECCSNNNSHPRVKIFAMCNITNTLLKPLVVYRSINNSISYLSSLQETVKYSPTTTWHKGLLLNAILP